MENENRSFVILRAGTEQMEIALTQAEEFLRDPEVIEVPRSGQEIAGMMEYRGSLIALFFLGGHSVSPAGKASCAAVFRKEEGGFYGILADEIG